MSQPDVLHLTRNGKVVIVKPLVINREKYVASTYRTLINSGDELIMDKYVCVLSSLNNAKDALMSDIKKRLREARCQGIRQALCRPQAEWRKIWAYSDVVIEGDLAAQQAIRFNIFQLNQTYTGKDERLNIGPKGFTGEKYGGSTYWDTEAFALPFFLKTADQKVARNLLLYRYKHLDASIKNAAETWIQKWSCTLPHGNHERRRVP